MITGGGHFTCTSDKGLGEDHWLRVHALSSESEWDQPCREGEIGGARNDVGRVGPFGARRDHERPTDRLCGVVLT